MLLYNADNEDIPFIMEHMDQLWGRSMDDGLGMEQRLSALAEYEWWFIQANPFGRGAASMTDAMSLVAQLKMGLSLRKKFEHLDFLAVSRTLPEYIEERVPGLRKHLPADPSQIGSVDKTGVKGGIDLAGPNLDLQIRRDGAGVPLPVSQQDLDNIHIDGLVPVILNIRPAAGLPLFNGAGAAVMEGNG